jgi:hypothetical protein
MGAADPLETGVYNPSQHWIYPELDQLHTPAECNWQDPRGKLQQTTWEGLFKEDDRQGQNRAEKSQTKVHAVSLFHT